MKDYGQKTGKYPNQEFLEDISPVDKLIDKIKKMMNSALLLTIPPHVLFYVQLVIIGR